MLAFYSDDPSLNAADAYSFFCKLLFEMNKYKQKEAGVGSFKKSFVFRVASWILSTISMNEHILGQSL